MFPGQWIFLFLSIPIQSVTPTLRWKQEGDVWVWRALFFNVCLATCSHIFSARKIEDGKNNYSCAGIFFCGSQCLAWLTAVCNLGALFCDRHKPRLKTELLQEANLEALLLFFCLPISWCSDCQFSISTSVLLTERGRENAIKCLGKIHRNVFVSRRATLTILKKNFPCFFLSLSPIFP